MLRVLRFIVAIALLYPALGIAQTPATPSEQPASTAASASAFDVRAAVDAYLAKMPAERRAKSDAYFEGGYWLILWDLVVTLVVMWLLLHFRWSAKMRNLAERITRFRPLQTAIYWIQFIVVVGILTFPMSLYEGYFREHQYGLLNQSFGPWMGDQLKGLALGVILGAILIVPLFGLVR